ncbi:MAG: hypothetical protein ACI841_000335 [Planctomycetota bacterium]
MPKALENNLRLLQRRERLATFLGVFSKHLALALCVGGSIALILRLGAGLSPAEAAWALAVAAIAPFSAYWVARQRFLSPESVAAWLDLRTGATGLVVTELEAHDERWQARSESVIAQMEELPRMHLRPAATRSFASLGFAALALLVDVSGGLNSVVPPAVYQPTIEELREKLEALEETVGMEEERAQELDDRMEALEKEAQDSTNPEATFEALDQLGKELERDSEEAKERAIEAFEALDAAAEASEIDPEAAQAAIDQAASELSELELSKELANELGGDLLPENFELTDALKLDPAALQELSAAMQELLQKNMDKLAKAGLFEGVKLSSLAHLGEGGTPGDLAKFELHECDENCEKPGGT